MQQAFETVAFGVDLQLAETAQGGRRTPLHGGAEPEERFKYRPNWGLPDMVPPDQTAALVFGFSKAPVAPGDQCRVVIVPPLPEMLAQWATVRVGDLLPMYEGTRIRGHGRILWRRHATLPLSADDERVFQDWLLGPESVGEPEG